MFMSHTSGRDTRCKMQDQTQDQTARFVFVIRLSRLTGRNNALSNVIRAHAFQTDILTTYFSDSHTIENRHSSPSNPNRPSQDHHCPKETV